MSTASPPVSNASPTAADQHKPNMSSTLARPIMLVTGGSTASSTLDHPDGTASSAASLTSPYTQPTGKVVAQNHTHGNVSPIEVSEPVDIVEPQPQQQLQQSVPGYPYEYYDVKPQPSSAPAGRMPYGYPMGYHPEQFPAPPTYPYYKGYPLNYPPVDHYGQPTMPQYPSEYAPPTAPRNMQPPPFVKMMEYAHSAPMYRPPPIYRPHQIDPRTIRFPPNPVMGYADYPPQVPTHQSPMMASQGGVSVAQHGGSPSAGAPSYSSESPSKVGRSAGQTSYGKVTRTRNSYGGSSGQPEDHHSVLPAPPHHTLPAATLVSGAFGADAEDAVIFSEEISRAQVANRFGLVFQKYYGSDFPYERIRVWKSKGGLTFYDCSCGKRKPSQGIKKMREHVDRHQTRAFKCEACAQIYEDQNLLRAHSHVHSGQVPNCAERMRAIEASISQ